MRNETVFMGKAHLVENANISGGFEATRELYGFLQKVLKEAQLPVQSGGTSKTELYLVLLIITDAVWIVTTVGLCVGACCQTNKKMVLSMLFYGPWLLCSAFINFLDVVSSVHYGLDLIYIQSYTTWLTFVGVGNPQNFTHFDDLTSSAIVPLLPTSVLVSLLSRFFLIWLLNVICFFTVLFLAIPDVMPRIKTRQPNTNAPSWSEARIRNWCQFNVQANSTMATTGTSSIDSQPSNSRELTPRNKLPVQISLDHYSDPSYTKAPIEGSSVGYQKFQGEHTGISGIVILEQTEDSGVNSYV